MKAAHSKIAGQHVRFLASCRRPESGAMSSHTPRVEPCPTPNQDIRAGQSDSN